VSSLKIITTSDGSHSLLNEQLNETYHSVHGALQESLHVFIKHGLDFVAQNQKTINILEVGFGTGLNALLTAQSAKTNNLTVRYTSLEAFPVEENIWSQLNYVDSPESVALFEKLHRAKWDQPENISSNFILKKMETTLQEVQLERNHFDLIYFDAFAPNKQPEMWVQPVFRKVADSMKNGGVFVTYCAKGQVKRDLQTVGLEVETLQGPPGKREMVRAVRTNNS
jgi:tRNA U34 5-methylaminomethyl-2-thiouridine-forming methyltransferase MnmC